jgi:hypothetical protein
MLKRGRRSCLLHNILSKLLVAQHTVERVLDRAEAASAERLWAALEDSSNRQFESSTAQPRSLG